MPGKTFLPSREASLLAWSNNLATRLVGAPTDYGVTLPQAEAYAATQSAFAVAYGLLQDPATRNKPNVADKNTKKQALIEASREMVRIIQAWPEMTDKKREELQVTVPDVDPTPVPVPATMPRITFISALGRVVEFKVNDVDETRRGRPPQVAAALIYTYVGETPPLDIKQWNFQGPSTKVVNDVTFPVDTPAGATAWFTAVWVNRRMQPGPATNPVSINIAGGGVAAKAA